MGFIQNLPSKWSFYAGAAILTAAFSNYITLLFHNFSYFRYATIYDHTARSFQFFGFVLISTFLVFTFKKLKPKSQSETKTEITNKSNFFKNITEEKDFLVILFFAFTISLAFGPNSHSKDSGLYY